MTNSDSEQQRSQFDWGLWLQWLLATTLGWLVGLFLLGEGGIGASVGLAQWLVLRREVANAGWWILVSAVAWLVGWELITAGLLPPGTNLISALIVGAIMGSFLGVGQWLLLRRWTHYASLWLPANLSAWSVSFSGMFGGAIMAGVVAGAVTGLVLDLLLRYPRSEKEIS